MASVPTTMKQYTLSHRKDLSGLTLATDATVPKLTSPTQVLINMKALSLNARDLQIATGIYPAPHTIPDDLVPVSDGAGVVVAVGEGVTDFAVGDKVAPLFPQGHHFEEDMSTVARDRGLWAGLGGGRHGIATEYFAVEQVDVVKLPEYMSYEDGACLPVAAATAWCSLFGHHPALQAGQTVLCLGTGGVSLAAAQFALISSCKVILTSSSATKLARAVELLKPCLHSSAPANALQTIDYSKITDWDKEARRLNGGPVDFVIEIGGQGTIGRSIKSTKPGGMVVVSGYLSDYGHIPQDIKEEDVAKLILYSAANVRGTFVANKYQFMQMVSSMEMSSVKPIIDKVFKFEELKDAYEYMQAGKHMGKVVVTI
ncbi:hypothetical protein MNV49_003051 [Pseudohyphozyma bogoriensis]|nr:hypothetical protein MNV49_003051 [Pseudohyphozyma bogoriensis]